MRLDHPLFTTWCCISFYFDYFKDAVLNGDYEEAIEYANQVLAYLDEIQQKVFPAPFPKDANELVIQNSRLALGTLIHDAKYDFELMAKETPLPKLLEEYKPISVVTTLNPQFLDLIDEVILP